MVPDVFRNLVQSQLSNLQVMFTEMKGTTDLFPGRVKCSLKFENIMHKKEKTESQEYGLK